MILGVRKARIATENYSEKGSLGHCHSHSYQESLRTCLIWIFIFTFRSIKLSFGLQEFQLGIITEDTMGQVPQFVAG